MYKQQSWWGQRLITTLESFTDHRRLQKGRSYATSRRIENFLLEGNLVLAHIRGNVNPYYGVYTAPTYITTIEFRAFSRDRWQLGIAKIARSAKMLSQLMANEIPEDIGEVLAPCKLSLLPRSSIEITTECDCPDYENPCKHIAGLYYYLAQQIDQDPLLLFELRGLGREELIEELSKSPLGAALAAELQTTLPEPVPTRSYYTRSSPDHSVSVKTLSDFWLSPQPQPEAPPPPPAVPALHVKKQGDQPAFWDSPLSFIDTMEALYERVKDYHRDRNF